MWKKLANWAIKLGLTGGSVAYLLMSGKVDLHAAMAAMSDFSLWYFFGAMALQVVQVAICAIRWQAVLRAIGAHLPFLRAAELFSIGNFFGQILPGAVGGDAIRMLATRRAGLDLGAAINSVMLERGATVYALVLLTTIAEPALLDRLKDAPTVWLFPLLTVGATAGLSVL
ncbi:MAG TPA: lysylphosphatidylglycerol synthase transmembrane domain-containing protein, partial [Magnetospirillaceae bacterium]|nr:lysylphosphatidylglycerol synthase transmembrane domain-containing protein [Magnetospirillaceae bacterium]